MHVNQSQSCYEFFNLHVANQKKHTTIPIANANNVNMSNDIQYLCSNVKRKKLLVTDKVNVCYGETIAKLDNELKCAASTMEEQGTNADQVDNHRLSEEPMGSEEPIGSADNYSVANFADNVTSGNAQNTSSLPFNFSCDSKWTLKLLKLLDDMNAPDYAFREILLWARGATQEGFSFYPKGGLDRRRNIQCIRESLKHSQLLLPSIVTVNLPTEEDSSPAENKVIVFDFVPQLLSLLQNRQIMVQENLVIDVTNPLQPFQPSNNMVGEALSGTAYRDAYNFLIQDPSKEMLIPIIQWIDRTTVTGNDRFSLKPYMFTLGIFTEQFRRQITAWAYHGFLPKSNTSTAQNQTKKRGANIRHYHAQLATVLETFRTAGPRLKNVVLPVGPTQSMVVDVITCVLFIIQDMQEGDMLCGRYGSHTSGIQRHCRACDVAFNDLDDPFVQCKYLYCQPMDAIATGDCEEQRKRWSQHRLNNTYNSICFADPDRGIFGATPVETMHAYRKGVIEVVTHLVLENVPAGKKAALDALAIRFHSSHRQTHRKVYPSTDFSNGITNLTKISASERLGLVFLFVILAQYDIGWNILNDCLEKRVNTNLKEVLHVFEAMLCFDAWLNQTSYWTLDHEMEAMKTSQQSIQRFMTMCKQLIPCAHKDRWKFPKFHELLHIVDDIQRFGAPTNFCAQRPESLLIIAAKRPGRRAQKRHHGSAYELQAAQRLSESILIQFTCQRLATGESASNEQLNADPPMSCDLQMSNHIDEGTGNATFGLIQRHVLTGSIEVTWRTTTKIELMTIPTTLVQYLCKEFGNYVEMATEYVRDKYVFRCHPSYQSSGAIYDWMNVVFEEGTYPSKLMAVVVKSSNHGEGLHLVVQSASRRTHVDSVLFREWDFSEDYYTITPDSIESPVFVISIQDEKSNKILETLSYEDWPSQFTQQYISNNY